MSHTTLQARTQYHLTNITAFTLAEDETLLYGEALFHCLVVVTTGSLTCSYVEDYLVHKGDSLLLDCQHSLQLKGQQLTTGYIVMFQQLATKQALPQGRYVRVRPFGQFSLQLEQLFERMQAQQHFACQIQFLQLLERVWQASEQQFFGDAKSKVEESITYIQKHYALPFSVEQLAQQANLSRRQYTRIFKKLTLATPIAYINQYRIFRAQELLLQTTDSVQKIALCVGFDDVHYFNRLFKKAMGCSPKGYIQLRQTNPRVATLHYAGELLALGITPIADLQTTLLQLATTPSDIIAIGTTCCHVEQLRDLAPDIVIASDAIACDELSQIEKFVPTIVIPWDMNPVARLQKVAQVIGKRDQAVQFIAHYEAEKQQLKPYYSPTKRAVVLRLDEGKVWLHAARFFPIFYEVVQYQISAIMAQTTEVGDAMKRYAIALCDIEVLADVEVLYVVTGYEADFPEWLAALQAHPAWCKLPAVQAGNVHVLAQQGLANSLYNQRYQLATLKKTVGLV